MKIILHDFNAKLRGDNIFKPIIRNDSLQQDSNDNGVRLVKFAISKKLVVSTMFPHLKIHQYSRTSPSGKTRNQTDHILIERRWHSCILDVRSCREVKCDTDHYLMVAKIGEKLTVIIKKYRFFMWKDLISEI